MWKFFVLAILIYFSYNYFIIEVFPNVAKELPSVSFVHALGVSAAVYLFKMIFVD